MDIGHRVRELRESRGLTIRALSDRTGLAENSIYRIERGERVPSATSVEAIARGLGVAPGELFEEPALLGKALAR
jgi:transcriptional regulator with XRE-family HTH domain